jgi:hypothetical protein
VEVHPPERLICGKEAEERLPHMGKVLL